MLLFLKLLKPKIFHKCKLLHCRQLVIYCQKYKNVSAYISETIKDTVA
jgi:hypothetical protein